MGRLLSLFKSIHENKTPPWKLRFLDLEFNSHTKRVFEIGMCDANGAATMDCRTRYAYESIENTVPNPDKPSTLIEHGIRQSRRKHNCIDGTMSARQVANLLREQGVGPSTIFATWHTSTADLVALKQWLEAEGEYDVLPGKSNCIPVVPHFRYNFEVAKAKDGRVFPLKLPTIFPLLMTSRHYLYGRNHHALADAQQLYFMMRVFEMMCKRPEDRALDWLGKLQQTPDPSANKFQRTLTS